jgi:hypothetical protein
MKKLWDVLSYSLILACFIFILYVAIFAPWPWYYRFIGLLGSTIIGGIVTYIKVLEKIPWGF